MEFRCPQSIGNHCEVRMNVLRQVVEQNLQLVVSDVYIVTDVARYTAVDALKSLKMVEKESVMHALQQRAKIRFPT